MAGVSRSSNETIDFTDDEIRSELSRLGYEYIDGDQFSQFKRDLYELVESEKSYASTEPSYTERHEHLYSAQGLEKENADSPKDLYKEPMRERKPFMTADNVWGSQSYRPSYQSKKPAADSFTRSLPAPAVNRNNHNSSDIAPRGVAAYYDTDDSVAPLRHESNTRYQYEDDSTTVDSSNLYGTVDAEKYTDKNEGPYAYINEPAGSDQDRDRLQGGVNDLYNQSSTYEDTPLDSSRVSQSSVVKRKVSTKLPDGSTAVFEQSYQAADSDVSSDSEQSDVDSIEAISNRLRKSLLRESKDAMPFSTAVPASSRPQSARYNRTIDPVKSSVIWPAESRQKGSMKSDPVKSFQSYQQMWKRVQAPEDKKHKNLRWAVREQMLYKDVIYEKPKKQYVENKYVVPTDKKRKDLRWRIRADMAAGFLPSGNP